MPGSGLGRSAIRAAVARLAAAGCVLPDEEVEAALSEWGMAAPLEVAARLEDYISRRERGEPPAYILGGVRFRGAWVSVGPGAFIPRPWTEGMVDTALRLAESPLHVVDIGTGAGPLAMAVAAGLPAARIWATEPDPGALRWAHANLDRLANVTVLDGDLFDPLPPMLRGEVDLAVGCLPYVPSAAVAAMPRDFREYEPVGAFDGGPDGLRVVERALDQAREWVRPGGWIVLEIGAGQGVPAVRIAEGLGYRDVAAQRDAEGDDAAVAARR